MPQHLRLNMDFQPRRVNIRRHSRSSSLSVQFGRREILVRLYKRRDIDLEAIEGRRAIANRKRVRDRADAMQNGILKGWGGRRAI